MNNRLECGRQVCSVNFLEAAILMVHFKTLSML